MFSVIFCINTRPYSRIYAKRMYTMQLYKWLQMCYNNVTNISERSSIFLKFAIVDADNNLRRLISLALNRV